jgi:Predicted S-adenosylmethionine-dependent methyltransferase
LDYPERVPDEFNGRKGRCVDFVDVGCGFGGLLSIEIFLNFLICIVALSQKFPDNLSFGMEIRDKLCNYVGEKIRALRIEHPGQV